MHVSTVRSFASQCPSCLLDSVTAFIPEVVRFETEFSPKKCGFDYCLQAFLNVYGDLESMSRGKRFCRNGET